MFEQFVATDVGAVLIIASSVMDALKYDMLLDETSKTLRSILLQYSVTVHLNVIIVHSKNPFIWLVI